ncbi:LytTR family DNA-binding domain-containing protein [Pollutibacter soli]|uniref:LytTR family DNA-binding domain-containing protein n=1 Tax=Pollutibacter soli TaxID=3034157 RepID=UPI00301392FE
MSTQMNQNDSSELNTNGYTNSLSRNISANTPRTTLIAREGNTFIPLRAKQIAVFYSLKKEVIAIDFSGNRFHIDQSLTDIETSVESNVFFRVNRNIILHFEAIRLFRVVEFGKIIVDLVQPEWLEEEVHISQYRAPRFREWISNV